MLSLDKQSEEEVNPLFQYIIDDNIWIIFSHKMSDPINVWL